MLEITETIFLENMESWMPNWEALEAQYNRLYDPYAIECPECKAEDCFEEDEDLDGTFWFCQMCGHRMELQ